MLETRHLHPTLACEVIGLKLWEKLDESTAAELRTDCDSAGGMNGLDSGSDANDFLKFTIQSFDGTKDMGKRRGCQGECSRGPTP